MSSLILVRHGQASFFAKDYDRLSALGRQQSRELAKYWLSQAVDFDEVYCGPRRRHRETLAGLRETYARADVPWPADVTLPELDEHHLDQLVTTHREALGKRSPELRRLALALAHATEPADQHRRFQLLFEAVARQWVQGVPFEVEPWSEFRRRVHLAIDRIVQQAGRGRRVLVVTSVGPVTVALQRAMDCSDEVALATGWRLWNSSLTSFVFSRDRFTLDGFNAMPHLPEQQWTYR